MEEFKSWDMLTELEQAQHIYSDMHKDAYGFRPRGVNTLNWTLEDFEAEFEFLGAEINRAEAERKIQEQHAIEDFEDRVAKSIEVGAANRETALQWIMAADQCNGDWEYLAYTNGLPYRYFDRK